MKSLPKPKRSAGSMVFDAAFVLFGALTIQFLYVKSAPAVITSDSIHALRGALEFISSDTIAILGPDYVPGYSLFIAGIIAVAGKAIAPVLTIQHLMLAVLASLATVVVRIYSNRSYSLCAGFLIALDPVSAFCSSWVLPDFLFVFLITCAVLSAFDAHRSPLLSAISGLLFGSAVLVETQGVVLWLAAFSLILLSSLIRRDDMKQTSAALLLFTLSFLLLLVPWIMYRSNVLGDIGIAKENKSLTRIERLQQTMLFDPYLIADKDERALYQDVLHRYTRSSPSEKKYFRPMAEIFRDELVKRGDEKAADRWFHDYLTEYRQTHPQRYWTQVLLSFASLLQLNSDAAYLPHMANDYLGEKISPSELLKRSGATEEETQILLSYQARNEATESWRSVLHDIQTYKAVCSLFLLFLVFVSIYALARGSLFDPIFLLPYLIFTVQAASQAYLLQNDDRLTLIFSPLLFVQLALLLGAVGELAKTRR
ncbi:MAG: glycosyltransferase family 39 protein [Bdellovibrionales bacterium]|nr:glycosyltransferase family 39 protein [Bdellovibrionales bacterium]